MTSYFGPVEVILDHAAATYEELLPQPGVGFEWRVLGWFMVSAGAANVTFNSGAAGVTPRTGPIPCAANTGVGPSMCPPGSGARWFSGGENEAIGWTLSGAVQVSGALIAEKVPAGS